MGKSSLSYERIAWVYGTTSMRPAQLNLKIEQQLHLLSDLYQRLTKAGKGWSWHNNNELQEEYYTEAKKRGIVKGNAPRKAKDSRVLTSGLVDLGLVTEDRQLTPVGQELLDIVTKNEGVVGVSNFLSISDDSYLYFKQLLKISLSIGDKAVRPYVVLIKLLTDFDFLTFDEFRYLIPLISTKEDYLIVHRAIRELRRIDKLQSSKEYIDQTIWEIISSKAGYQNALDLLTKAEVSELTEVIPQIVLNRKSAKYATIYAEIYQLLKTIYLEKDTRTDLITDLYATLQKGNSKAIKYWRKALFKDKVIANTIRQRGRDVLTIEQNPFEQVKSDLELRSLFFRRLHLFKTKATLEDYFDLNCRYIKLSDTIIFEDDRLKLDLLPRCFFTEEVATELFQTSAFSSHSLLRISTELIEVTPVLTTETVENALRKCRKALGLKSTDELTSITEHIQKERTDRFKALVQRKFGDEVLIKLLEKLERREDKAVFQLVTDDADIPTIFEYIIGIIWYKVSGYRGDILSYMKLSLDAQLFPKSHAIGGSADIVYQYEADPDGQYPAHTLLIEATLTDNTSQRRAEMEPVSRHLGNYIIDNGAYTAISDTKEVALHDQTAQTLFIATHLHTNVRNDFYARRFVCYESPSVTLVGTKIVAIDTQLLANIIRRQITYSEIYSILRDFFTHTSVSSTEAYNQLSKAILRDNE